MATEERELEHAELIDLIDRAEEYLKLAREALKLAKCQKAVDAVRRALKSVGGARRHTALAPFRQMRRIPSAGTLANYSKADAKATHDAHVIAQKAYARHGGGRRG